MTDDDERDPHLDATSDARGGTEPRAPKVGSPRKEIAGMRALEVDDSLAKKAAGMGVLGVNDSPGSITRNVNAPQTV